MTTHLNAENRRSYRKLVLSIAASENTLNLLIAICDDRNLRQQIIQNYEAELRGQVQPYQVRLGWQQPSLRSSLLALVQSEAKLRQKERSVVTVLGADELIGVRLSEARSEQENFFFSLQWTREALREFEFPIVLWLSEAVVVRLAEQAPDFWSWRGGVVEFLSQRQDFVGQVRPPDMPLAAPTAESEELLAELLQQITALEQQDAQSPLLISLYNRLGEAQAERYEYPAALERYEKAYNLAQTLKAPAGRANALLNLGNAYENIGRYLQAIDFHEQALDIRREIGDRIGEVNSLISLGNLYYRLGQSPRSIEFQQQSLEIARGSGYWLGESASLIGLGNAYLTLGEYQRAIEFYQQSLEIKRKVDDRLGETILLGNLGSAYLVLGEYQRALEFQQQSLEIAREIGDRRGEGVSLGNLGSAYYSLGEYPQSIEFYQQSLEIKREIGDRTGEADSLIGLGNAYYSLGEYPQSIEFYQQSLEIKREIGDRRGEAISWLNLGNPMAELDQKSEDVISAYENARRLFQDMKLDHMVERCDVALREYDNNGDSDRSLEP